MEMRTKVTIKAVIESVGKIQSFTIYLLLTKNELYILLEYIIVLMHPLYINIQ